MPHPRTLRRTTLRCAIATLLLSCSAVQATGLLDPSAPSSPLARRGLDALHAGDHAAAETLLTRWVLEYPDDPLAPLARMKLWWWAILEGRSGLEDELDADFERTRERAERRLGTDENDW
jgi:hypothetical protein